MSTPRIKNLRHREYEHTRYSKKFLGWLGAQAARLTVTASLVFEAMRNGMTAVEVEQAVAMSVPANTVLPTITGTATVGQTLTSATGTWTGAPAPYFTRQWKRNGVAIDGATASAYTLVAADLGKTITLTVTGTNPAGSASATSAGKGPVA